LKLRFDQLAWFLDDMGGIRFYENNHHEEHHLGSVDDNGVFTPSAWLDFDGTGLAQLKISLQKAYFGETELYVDKPQSEWHEGLVKFIELPEIDAFCQELEPVYVHSESPLGQRRRYQKENGEVLDGVYARTQNGLVEWLLINAGCLKKSFNLKGDSKKDVYGQAKFLIVDQHEVPWKKVDKSEEFMEEKLAQAVLLGELPRAEIYVGRRNDMLNWAEKAEAQGLEVEVYSHRSDHEKYRMILASSKTASTWLPKIQLEDFLGSCELTGASNKDFQKALLEVWESVTPKTTLAEEFSLEAKTFLDCFWKGHPLRVALAVSGL
jgi:hypothetical protein